MGGALGGFGGFGGSAAGAAGAGGQGGCDLGCQPNNSGPSQCDSGETTWLCRNEADLTQFLANCQVLPTGLVRFCCPNDFAPKCD
jgi:hypothetical protein